MIGPARALAAGLLLAAVACTAPQTGGAEASPAPGRAATPALPAFESVATEAPKGTEAAEPDKWPAPVAAPMATIPMRLVRGVTDVDAQPRTIQLTLQPEPAAGVDASALPPGSWLHGLMSVTRTERVALAVRADRGAMWLDSNRDGVLQPSEEVPRKELFGGLAWFESATLVRQQVDGRPMQATMPVRVGVHLQSPMAGSRVDARREGVVKAGEREVRVAILDRTFRGWFSHPGLDALVVDGDGDGAFDASPDSSERYRLGEPFPAGDMDLVVTGVGPFGSTLTVAKSPKPAIRKSSLRIGTAAPVFSVKTIDGKPITSEALKGKWVLLDFWATWCGPCRNELPHLKELRRAHPDVVIVGVSGDQTAEAVTTFTAAQGMDWPQVHGDARPLMRDFRVSVFPTSFLLAPDGTIAARDLRGAATSAQVGSLKQQWAAKKG